MAVGDSRAYLIPVESPGRLVPDDAAKERLGSGEVRPFFFPSAPPAARRDGPALWAVPSAACHHHPYDVAPASHELREWIGVAARLNQVVSQRD